MELRIMRIAIAVASMILVCTMVCLSAVSAPIGGSWQAHKKIEGKEAWSQTRAFRGGERAAVLAIGDHQDPSVRVQIAVFDAKGVLIAEDKGSEPASDYAGLVWYPPRDGDYRIVVRHSGVDANKVYIAIK